MEIDDKLKNRLAGVAVVTVLAVIFLPMMFDDPVEKKGQVVSELDIPHKPEVSPLLTTVIVPDKSAEVTAKPKTDATNVSEKPSEDVVENTELSNAELNAEKTPLDSDTGGVEEEKTAPIKKKARKKAHVNDDSKAEKEPVKHEEKIKPEKKPSKAKLPNLGPDFQDKQEASATPASDNRRWVVQVASLSDESKAIAFRDKLRSQGFPATVDSAWIAGKGRVYRLKVGPELDAQKALSMKAKINELNNVQSIAKPE